MQGAAADTELLVNYLQSVVLSSVVLLSESAEPAVFVSFAVSEVSVIRRQVDDKLATSAS